MCIGWHPLSFFSTDPLAHCTGHQFARDRLAGTIGMHLRSGLGLQEFKFSCVQRSAAIAIPAVAPSCAAATT